MFGLLKNRLIAMIAFATIASPATAIIPVNTSTPVYQATPNLTVTPVAALCSPCEPYGPNTQIAGGVFHLSSLATIASITFAAQTPDRFNPVTIGIYRKEYAAGGVPVVGTQMFRQTFSTFTSLSTYNTYFHVATASIGSLDLSGGDYVILFQGGYEMGLLNFATGDGGGIYITNPNAGLIGSTLQSTWASAGFTLNGPAQTRYPMLQALGGVPEPATWALMIGGFGLVGSAARRRTKLSLARVAGPAGATE